MSENRGGSGNLIFGLILVVVGSALLLDRFDAIPFGGIGQFWPMILVAIGIGQLVRPDSGRRSIFLLLMGVWLQISVLGLWGLDFGESWPLLFATSLKSI